MNLSVITLFPIVILFSIYIKQLIKFKHLPGSKSLFSFFIYSLNGWRKGLTLEEAIFNFVGKITRKSENGICTQFFGAIPIVFAYNPESVEQILRNDTTNLKPWVYEFVRPLAGYGLVQINGIKWKKRRKVLTPAFHFDILKTFIPIFNKHSMKLIVDLKKISGKKIYFDILPFLNKQTFEVLCETSLGYEFNHNEQDIQYLNSLEIIRNLCFKRIFNPLLWNNYLFKLSFTYKELTKHSQITEIFITKIIQNRKLNAKKLNNTKRLTFLDLLIQHQFESNELSDEEIKGEINSMMFAGHETTATFLAWILSEIGNRNEVQNKLREEINNIFPDEMSLNEKEEIIHKQLHQLPYMDIVIKEAMRLYPQGPLISRTLTKPLTVNGYNLPVNTNVFIPIYYLHRNENYFYSANKFRPERFSTDEKPNSWSFIPFSAGLRNCIGQKFALIEIKLILIHILKNFIIKSEKPTADIRCCFRVTLFPLEEIKIFLTPLFS